MTAGSPLGQLADLLRKVEAKTRAQELTEEVGVAASQLRLAEQRIQQATERARQVRPVRTRELELVEDDEQLLKELIRRTAQTRALMGDEEFREAERLIETSRSDLEAKRSAARSELDEVQSELDRSRTEVRAALDRYQQARRELERLEVAAEDLFEEGDRLAHAVETYFPEYQVRAFAREIEDGAAMFGMLDRREQYAQMKIWIGRLRRFQTTEPGTEQREVLEGVFRRLVSLSKQHEPGYIEAFNRQYVADWDAYVAEAQEALRLASEDARRGREQQGRQAESDRRDAEQRREARRQAERALGELKAHLLAESDDPEARADRFREALARVVDGYGPPDEELLDLVRPHREWLVGPEFRNLRKHFDQEDEEEARRRQAEEAREQYEDLLDLTRSRRALMIGGALREDARRLLLKTFEFDDLEWVAYQDNKPVLLDSLIERVRNGQYDLVILLLNFIGHHVSGAFRPLCKDIGIPCAMVEHGYGAVQVAEALRRTIPGAEAPSEA